MTTRCHHCRRPVANPHRHHPDREGRPDHTVDMHPECHWAHHRDRGDCAAWGAMTPTAGPEGYRHTLKACPGFHHLGGAARAAGARRDPVTGQFMRGTR